MGRKKSYNLWESGARNTVIADTLRNQIIGMALSRFKWVNLPKTCNERYLEIALFYNGQATIASPYSGEHKGEWLSLQIGGIQRQPDMYGNPKMWTALGMNGYQFNVTPDNGYFCYDNHQRVPIFPRIDMWVNELVDVINTMRQNRVHQKVPLIISGVQEKKLDLTNYVKQVSGGEVLILTTDGISNMNAQTLTPSNGIPFIGEQLWATYLSIWNQIYMALGIKNLTFKNERMIEDEVKSQIDPTSLVALDELECRREMCDYLNNKFEYFKDNPLNVVWRSDNITDNYNIIHNLQDYLQVGDDNDNGLS